MRQIRVAILIGSTVTMIGCALVAPPPVNESPQLLSSVQTADTSCEMLGLVTAEADCACYDKMSYDRVRGAASRNLEEQARAQYPDLDRLEVSGVDLYLNNAKAHGVAYKCVSASI